MMSKDRWDIRLLKDKKSYPLSVDFVNSLENLSQYTDLVSYVLSSVDKSPSVPITTPPLVSKSTVTVPKPIVVPVPKPLTIPPSTVSIPFVPRPIVPIVPTPTSSTVSFPINPRVQATPILPQPSLKY